VALEFAKGASRAIKQIPNILKIEVSCIGLLTNVKLQCIRYFKQFYIMRDYGVNNISRI
jgi:hypothetical protein